MISSYFFISPPKSYSWRLNTSLSYRLKPTTIQYTKKMPDLPWDSNVYQCRTNDPTKRSFSLKTYAKSDIGVLWMIFHFISSWHLHTTSQTPRPTRLAAVWCIAVKDFRFSFVVYWILNLTFYLFDVTVYLMIWVFPENEILVNMLRCDVEFHPLSSSHIMLCMCIRIQRRIYLIEISGNQIRLNVVTIYSNPRSCRVKKSGEGTWSNGSKCNLTK